jgi:AcrR family transcriptional regulator
VDVPRWEPDARERLRDAALDLFLEHGYDAVTATQITERAGLTRRTFFRHFADKRDVLFAGSEELPGAVEDAVAGADATLPAYDAMTAGLVEVAARLARVAHRPADRRTVIEASEELQERERTKLIGVAEGVTAGLRRRRVHKQTAELLGQVGAVVFQAAFEGWAGRGSLPTRVRRSAERLAAGVTG